jgi:PAS domain S-box-containing protein
LKKEEGKILADNGSVRPSPHEIMVIDDNPTILKLLSKILVEKGYVVRPAVDGAMALESVTAHLPDLILLDVKMTDLDGFQVCRILKSKAYSKDIPIIFISALDDTEQKIEGFKAGGVDYITKPFQSDEVLARVKTHLELRELTERLEQKVDERTTELTQANLYLQSEIAQRIRTEQALQQAHDNLELMVEKRTAELSMKNRQLTIALDKRRKTEQALRQSEITYRTIFETTACATMIIEQDATLSLVNTEFENLTGYTKEQIEGKIKWTKFIVKEDLTRMKEYHQLRRTNPKISPRNYECRVIGKNGHIRNIFVTVGMMPESNRSVASFLDVSKLKNIEKTLRESESRLRYLSSRLLAAQETERQRISLEIHDELGQNLAVLKLQLNALAGRLRKDQSALKNELKEMLGFIDHIIEEMRRISRDLSPAIIQDLDLCRSLEWMLHDFSKHTGIDVSKKMIDIDAMFNSKEQIIIYRIFQEALNNIRKHALAQHVRVSITRDNENVCIAIEDNGQGFDLDEVWNRHVAQRGLGIASLEERTRMLGGIFDLTTKVDEGTRLTLTIPQRPKRGDA